MYFKVLRNILLLELFELFRFKGEGMIDASPETCFQHCNPKPGTTRASWDTSIKSLEMVKAIQLDQWPVNVIKPQT